VRSDGSTTRVCLLTWRQLNTQAGRTFRTSTAPRDGRMLSHRSPVNRPKMSGWLSETQLYPVHTSCG
jgi:hypothetical protein